MMHFSRTKFLTVLGICLLGILICVPNVLKKPVTAIPWHSIHLGLDLQGGTYLLMQVDTKTMKKERLETLRDTIRQTLLDAGLGYKSLRTDGDTSTVMFMPRTELERKEDLASLNKIVTATPNEFKIESRPEEPIIVTLSSDAMKQRARETISQSIEIVRRRIDATGAVDPQITQQGNDRIVVQLPGISDPERVKSLLGTTAKMTFHLLEESAIGATVAPPMVTMMPMANNNDIKLPVRNRIEVDGSNLTSASAGTDPQTGEWAVNFTFDSVGAKAFTAVTRNNIGRRFAIVLDNKVVEAPVIRTAIAGGSGQITGGFDAQKATDLALLLRAGALPAPLTVIEQRSIGPSLGADAIRAGTFSIATGFLLVVTFMFLFYGRFGLYANLALLANLFLMLGVLSVLEATLTLPGMAGMLLTLGMAVDANILINERIREELRHGRTPLAAMEAGFKHATNTIIDSNATAFLSHVMLFTFGTGPVRGFALTITIGIITTLFTTLILSNMLMVRWYGQTRPKTLPV